MSQWLQHWKPSNIWLWCTAISSYNPFMIYPPFVFVIFNTIFSIIYSVGLRITVLKHSARHDSPLKICYLTLVLYQLILHDLCFIQFSMIYVCTWPSTGQCTTVRLTPTLFHCNHHYHLQIISAGNSECMNMFYMLDLASSMAVTSVHRCIGCLYCWCFIVNHEESRMAIYSWADSFVS